MLLPIGAVSALKNWTSQESDKIQANAEYYAKRDPITKAEQSLYSVNANSKTTLNTNEANAEMIKVYEYLKSISQLDFSKKVLDENNITYPNKDFALDKLKVATSVVGKILDNSVHTQNGQGYENYREQGFELKKIGVIPHLTIEISDLLKNKRTELNDAEYLDVSKNIADINRRTIEHLEEPKTQIENIAQRMYVQSLLMSQEMLDYSNRKLRGMDYSREAENYNSLQQGFIDNLKLLKNLTLNSEYAPLYKKFASEEDFKIAVGKVDSYLKAAENTIGLTKSHADYDFSVSTMGNQKMNTYPIVNLSSDIKSMTENLSQSLDQINNKEQKMSMSIVG